MVERKIKFVFGFQRTLVVQNYIPVILLTLDRTRTVSRLSPCSYGTDTRRHNSTLYVIARHGAELVGALCLICRPLQHYYWQDARQAPS